MDDIRPPFWVDFGCPTLYIGVIILNILWMGRVIGCNRSCFAGGLVPSWIQPATNRISLSSVSWAKGETPRESVCEWSLVLSSPAKQIIPICTATVFVTTFSPSHL